MQIALALAKRVDLKIIKKQLAAAAVQPSTPKPSRNDLSELHIN